MVGLSQSSLMRLSDEFLQRAAGGAALVPSYFLMEFCKRVMPGPEAHRPTSPVL